MDHCSPVDAVQAITLVNSNWMQMQSGSKEGAGLRCIYDHDLPTLLCSQPQCLFVMDIFSGFETIFSSQKNPSVFKL